jgi:hypothetical protein
MLGPARISTWLNGRGHRLALNTFLVIVLAHLAEHVVQAVQIWVLDLPRPQSRGVLGQFFPWLISSEWLHYAYAFVMLIGLFILRKGFTGVSRTWWVIALLIQFWHHIEHLVLLLQAQLGWTLLGRSVPTSFVQLIAPRVELHLFYNTVVFAPMVVAMLLHMFPPRAKPNGATCSCAVRRVVPSPA